MSNSKINYLVVFLIAAICAIVFKDYLVFKKAYFFYDINGDGYYGIYPTMYSNADQMARYGIPGWSFKVGMGQNIFPFLLRDPFDLILYLFGKDQIVNLAAYKEVIKIILSGWIFCRYLRLLNLSAFACITGSLLFAFSAMFLEAGPWFMFSFEAFNFAVLLLGFELLLSKKKGFWFTFAVFLYCISMPFNLYLYGIFLIFYAAFRLLQTDSFTFKKIRPLFLQMCLYGIAGMLVSAPFLMENVKLLLNSPRGSGSISAFSQVSKMTVFEPADNLQLGTSIMRFFSNDILGSGDHFKGWDTVLGAPLFYCGIICLLLIPQVFVHLNKRMRIVFAVFLVLWLLPVIFPFFRRALWLFTGDYYRGFSFMVSFVVLYYAIQALDGLLVTRKLNLPVLLASAAFLVALLTFPLFIERGIMDGGIRKMAIVAIGIYTIVMALAARYIFTPPFTALANDDKGVETRLNGKLRLEYDFGNFKALKYGLFLIIVAETCIFASITIDRRDSFNLEWLKTAKAIYNNYCLDAADHLKKTDHSFYRVDKNFFPESARYTSLNMAQVQGYYGTGSYSSFNQLYYIKYLQQMGVISKENESESRWAIGLLDNPALEAVNSVKYFFSTDNFHPVWHEMWDSLTKIGDVTIYKNNLSLPMGITYAQYIKESTFNILSPDQKKYISAKAIVIPDNSNKFNGLAEFNISDTLKAPLTFDTFRAAIRQTAFDTITIDHFEERKISGAISLSSGKMLYLSIPYDEGWHVLVDGKENEKNIVNGGMTGIMLQPGTHKIELFYRLQYLYISLLLSISGIIIFIVARWQLIKTKKTVEKPEN